MRRLSFLVASILCFASVLSGQAYKVVKIGNLSPDHNSATATGINSSGQVVGQSVNSQGQARAFVWTRTGAMQDLGDLGLGTSEATAINDAGVVVGSSRLVSGATHAFRWTATGGMQDLGAPLGVSSWATHVNSVGQVAGQCTDHSGLQHGCFWDVDGQGFVVEVLSQSFVQGFNNLGQEVGLDGGNIRGFVWDAADGFRILDGRFSWASDINDDGLIVGKTNGGAALWAPGGDPQLLGVLPGQSSSWALLINDAGHVSGVSPVNGKSHIFFWNSSDGMIDIGLLPGKPNAHCDAASLNNRDQIAGYCAGTLFWSAPTGVIQIPGNFRPAHGALNDAGVFVGTRSQVAYLASPIMHTTVTSSRNPSQVGDSVTFTSTVASFMGPPADGELVQFKDGAKVLGTSPLTNGTATFSTSALKAKTHSITATYLGDGNYFPNKSAILQQVVNP